MTPIEKITLESSASLMDVAAILLNDCAVKSELLAIHLPDLTDEQRAELQDQREVQLQNSLQLRANAANLRRIVAQLE